MNLLQESGAACNCLGHPRQNRVAWAASGAVVIALVAVLGLGGCGDVQSDAQATGAGGQRDEAAGGQVETFTRLSLSRCNTHVGFDLKIHGLGCEGARELQVPLVTTPFASDSGKSRAKVYDPNDPKASDWRCWARLDSHRGIFSHVCWHEDQVLMYKFAP